MELTHERAWRLFCYDPETGALSWRERRGNVAAGTVINSVDGKGHLRVRVDKKHYAVHRVVWLMVFGEWPREQIDHIDLDRKNNRIWNLRDVPCQMNIQNRPHPLSTNTSGYLGVMWDKKTSKWLAQIRANGKNICLGRFACPIEAAACRKEAALRLHRGFIA